MAITRSRNLPSACAADGALLVVGGHPADGILSREDAEVIEPEPVHLFLELSRRVHRAQQVTPRGLIGIVVANLIALLARLLHAIVSLHGFDVLLCRLFIGKQLHRADL